MLKICAMDRTLHNQWNRENSLKPVSLKKNGGNLRKVKPLIFWSYHPFIRRGSWVRVPAGSPFRTTDRTFKATLRLFPPSRSQVIPEIKNLQILATASFDFPGRFLYRRDGSKTKQSTYSQSRLILILYSPNVPLTKLRRVGGSCLSSMEVA